MMHLQTDAYRVEAFFDPATSSLSYLLFDRASQACALIDAVLDFQPATGHTSTVHADRMIARVGELKARVEWILETHVHADHLSAASYLKQALGGRIGIGANVVEVQAAFNRLFPGTGDPDPFDELFTDGRTFKLGDLSLEVLHTPGHTPACASYLLGDPAQPLAFVGDTLFTPDYGTARCDFPGGDGCTLYRSIQRLLCLPEHTQLLLCHDYRPEGRPLQWHTTVAEQRAYNLHANEGTSEQSFVEMRKARDATLAMPALMLAAVQVNLRAGRLPPEQANGLRYLRIPLNAFKDTP